MKNLPVLFAASALALAAALIAQEPSGDGHVKTYSVLPAQTLNLTNRDYHWVEVRTEYPVQFLAGPDCHNDSTVQWRCHFDQPADLFIRDLRVPPVFKQPKANTVTVTFWEN